MHKLRDRTDAGQRLSVALHGYADRSDVVILALGRGGVPIAYEVALALGCPLDIIMMQ